jgi:hypothetical protein
LQHYAGTASSGFYYFGLGLALRGDHLDAGAREEFALELEIGVFMIGKQNPRHGARL